MLQPPPPKKKGGNFAQNGSKWSFVSNPQTSLVLKNIFKISSKFAKYLTLPEIISHIMQNIIHSTFLIQTQLFGFVCSREAWLRTEFSVRSREAWLRTEYSVRSREARLRTEFFKIVRLPVNCKKMLKI